MHLGVVALSASRRFRQIRLPDRLILRGQRRLLPAPGGLVRIVLRAAADAHPLALPIRIFAVIERLRAGNCRAQRRCSATAAIERRSSIASSRNIVMAMAP